MPIDGRLPLDDVSQALLDAQRKAQALFDFRMRARQRWVGRYPFDMATICACGNLTLQARGDTGTRNSFH
jgi:hypothetical protein